MNFASVDIGNTAVKVSLWENPDGDPESFYAGSVGEAAELLKERGVDRIGFCTTRELSSAERKAVEDMGWWQLKSDGVLPMKIDYSSPATLGPDRVAAAIGARAKYPSLPLMIADVGTALTLDIVDGSGVYRGGNISPGLEMRFRALHEFTSRLPRVVWKEVGSHFGSDTESAIRNGVVWGLASEISQLFRLARKEYGCSLLALTGGDAQKIEGCLKTLLDNENDLIHEASLVARGLYEAYSYENDK